MRKSTSCAGVVKSILYQSFYGTFATKWGKDHETVAIDQFAEEHNVKVECCGLFIDKDYPYLAATPDGLIGEDGIVEVKCPSSASQFTPFDAIHEKKIKFAVFLDGQLNLKKSHNYYYQIQGQLHISRKEYCIFMVWTPLGLAFEKVSLNVNFVLLKNVQTY